MSLILSAYNYNYNFNCKHLFYQSQIERWWRELHHRLEKFFKRQLLMLLEQDHYDPDNQTDR